MSEQQLFSGARVVVQPHRGGLSLIGAITAALCVGWVAIGFLALRDGGVAAWVVAPTCAGFASLFGWVALWALRRRGLDEPALILDGAGLYDNVSLVRVGRLKWRDIDRVWLSMLGPFRFICVLPTDVKALIAEQDDGKKLLMGANMNVFAAPIVIPTSTLEHDTDALWEAFAAISGAPASLPSSTAAPG